MKLRKHLFLIISILSLILSSGCKFKWNTDFRDKFKEDEISTTFKFYVTKDSEDYIEKTYIIGQTISAKDFPVDEVKKLKSGFDFLGWSVKTGDESEVKSDSAGYVESFVVGENGLEFYGNWEGANVNYFIRYLFMDIPAEGASEGDYNYSQNSNYKDKKKFGKVEAYTSIEAGDLIQVEGFTAPALDDIEKKQIQAEGITVVEIKYKRNKYNFTLADYDDQEILNKDFYYEQTITLPEYTKEQGYEYKYVDEDNNKVETLPGIMPAKACKYKIERTALTVKYKVKHLFQAVDGSENYEEDSSYQVEDKEGKTGDQTEAKAKDVTGFEAQSITQVTISGDGSTVVEIKYTRKQFTVKFINEREDSSSVNEINVYYNANMDKSKIPDYTSDGTYVFAGWNTGKNAVTGISKDELASITVTEDITYYAIWLKKGAPKVSITLPPEETAIDVEGTDTKDKKLSITLNENYDSYVWIFDGEVDTQNTTDNFEHEIPLKTGTYEVTVIVTKDGKTYSGTFVITVEIGDVNL